MKQSKQKETGFTLIELSFVILISGIIMAVIISLSTVYLKAMKHEQMNRVIENAQATLGQYVSAFGHYPCPANPALPETDANYGAPDCSLPVSGGVQIGMFPLFGIEGADRIDFGRLVSTFETIQTNFVDPYGFRLTYAVTADLTNSLTYNVNAGRITIQDEYNRDTAGVKNDAHYAVLSFGENRDCPPTGSEAENCDGDSTFINSIPYDGDGLLKYDDRIAFYVTHDASLWSDHLNTSWVSQGDAKNDNSGNIGIKTNIPTEKLHVEGSLSTTTSVYSNMLCDDGTTNCMKPESLYNISCATGTYISGIRLNSSNMLEAICSPLSFAAPGSSIDCGTAGVRGIYTNGNVTCN